MKRLDLDDPELFFGRWQFAGGFEKESGRWRKSPNVTPPKTVWEFLSPFRLRITKPRGEPEETEYGYFPAQRELCVDHPVFDARGVCVAFIGSDLYRVERAGDAALWLYERCWNDDGGEDRGRRIRIRYLGEV